MKRQERLELKTTIMAIGFINSAIFNDCGEKNLIEGSGQASSWSELKNE